MAMAYLPRLMSRFIQGRNLSGVQLHGMPSHLVIEAVTAGQADIGFAAAPIERPGLRIEALRAQAVVAVPVNHRLAHRRTLRARDLDGEPMIALSEPSIFASRIDVLLAQVDCHIVASTPLSGIACSMVAAGSGVAVVDPFSVSDYLGRGVIAVALVPAIDVKVAIVTARHRRLSSLAEEFVAAVRGEIQAGPGALPGSVTGRTARESSAGRGRRAASGKQVAQIDIQVQR
jgi:DNA-binding transcriptional LysR family regulator